jgi:hypothetical protein
MSLKDSFSYPDAIRLDAQVGRLHCHAQAHSVGYCFKHYPSSEILHSRKYTTMSSSWLTTVNHLTTLVNPESRRH